MPRSGEFYLCSVDFEYLQFSIITMKELMQNTIATIVMLTVAATLLRKMLRSYALLAKDVKKVIQSVPTKRASEGKTATVSTATVLEPRRS